MRANRTILFNTLNHVKRRIHTLTKNKTLHIIIDCPAEFHFFHTKPIVESLKRKENYKITIIKWNDFHEAPISGVKYIDRNELENMFLSSYDIYFTTEFGRIPWWFDNCIKIYMLHGIGPKATYFSAPGLRQFNAVFSPGPFVEQQQRKYASDTANIYKIGLPALDRFNTRSSPFETSPKPIKFNNDKPILLYAPSWSNDTTYISMDEEILSALSEQSMFNVIIRPHPLLMKKERCGGKDWSKILYSLTEKSRNIVIYSEDGTSIYDIIECANVLLGDISSVTFEYLIFDRPIILYIKDGVTTHYGADEYIENHADAFHMLKSPNDLEDTLTDCICESPSYSLARHNLLADSLYNPGSATAAAEEAFNAIKKAIYQTQ